MNRYRNIFHRPVEDLEPGAEGELDLSAEREWELVQAARLEILPCEYEVIGMSSVFEHAPGAKFVAALPRGQEELLVAGGHIERVGEKPARKSQPRSKE